MWPQRIGSVSYTHLIALMWLAGYLGIAPEATMAFGDGENDLSMLEAAGVGIAMGNGLDIACLLYTSRCV